LPEQEVELEARYIDVEKGFADVEVAGMRVAGTSRQPESDFDDLTPEDAIPPPADLDALAKITQSSATRNSILDAMALNTVGLGYQIELVEGSEFEQRDIREDSVTLRQLLEALAGRDKRMDSPTFTELLKAVKKDEEEVGNGAIEVSRNKLNGRIDGLFHVPGKRVRRLKDRSGYVILDKDSHYTGGYAGGDIDKRVEFYNFGDKIEYDDEGKPSSSLASGKAWDTNELITFKLYSSESSDYGLPRDIGLALEYLGDKLAAEYNVSFFDSGGTPPTVIFVAGEEDRDGTRYRLRVPQETVSRITETLRSDSSHQKRVAIIPVPPGTNVNSVQLGTISDRDMGFNEFRKNIVYRQLGAFRLGAIFLPTLASDAGRYTAEIERAITLEQVFDPEQTRYEERLHRTILRDLDFAHLRINFRRLAVENNAAKRDSADKLAEAGSIQRKELRTAHGFAPLPEANPGEEPKEGQVPDGWNAQIVDLGQPSGAENRVIDGTGQQGLRPGIGARQQRSTDAEIAAQRVNGGAA
jgi:capsid portal protein